MSQGEKGRSIEGADSTDSSLPKPERVKDFKDSKDTTYVYSGDSTAPEQKPVSGETSGDVDTSKDVGPTSAEQAMEKEINQLYYQKRSLEAIIRSKKTDAAVKDIKQKELDETLKQIAFLEDQQRQADGEGATKSGRQNEPIETPAEAEQRYQEEINAPLPGAKKEFTPGLAARVDAAMAAEDAAAVASGPENGAEAVSSAKTGAPTNPDRNTKDWSKSAVEFPGKKGAKSEIPKPTEATQEAVKEALAEMKTSTQTTPEEPGMSLRELLDKSKGGAPATPETEPVYPQSIDERLDEVIREGQSDPSLVRAASGGLTQPQEKKPGRVRGFLTRMADRRGLRWLLPFLAAGGIGYGAGEGIKAIVGREQGPAPQAIVSTKVETEPNKLARYETHGRETRDSEQDLYDASYAAREAVMKMGDKRVKETIRRMKNIEKMGENIAFDSANDARNSDEEKAMVLHAMDASLDMLQQKKQRIKRQTGKSALGIEEKLSQEVVAKKMAEIDAEVGGLNELRGVNYKLVFARDEEKPGRPIVGYDLRIGELNMSMTNDDKAKLFEQALNLEADSAKKLAANSELSEKAIKYMTLVLARGPLETISHAGPQAEGVAKLVLQEIQPLEDELATRGVIERMSSEFQREHEVSEAFKAMGLMAGH